MGTDVGLVLEVPSPEELSKWGQSENCPICIKFLALI